jgi:hypothetical protein
MFLCHTWLQHTFPNVVLHKQYQHHTAKIVNRYGNSNNLLRFEEHAVILEHVFPDLT